MMTKTTMQHTQQAKMNALSPDLPGARDFPQPTLRRMARTLWRHGTLLAAGALALAVAGCGGGGGGDATPAAPVEAVVLSVSPTVMLEGNAGLQNFRLTVTLDKALVAAATLSWTTTSLAKNGVAGAPAGFATGGAACGGGVDYISTANSVTVPAGSGPVVTVDIPIVCGDADFEPNEVFSVNWSVRGAGGTVTATIVNDDAGGLNSVGVATVLGGAAAFGRDTNPLTNSNADGARGFSFAAAAGGCRSDNVTGLTWGTLDGFAYTQAAVAAQVTAANAGAGLCGFTDWRVPSTEELASLVDHSLAVTPVNADNGGGMSTAFWSNDSRTINDQLVVDFSALGAVGDKNKLSTASVRLVRGAAQGDPCATPGRYVAHGDGTVSDSKTGLMWKQCTEGLSGAACGTGAAFVTVNAGNTDAVTRLNTVNSNPGGLGLGYSDWRLPSRNELASLVCRGAGAAPLIDTATFPATDTVSYVTGTPHPAGGSWFVNFDATGAVGATSAASKRVRLVRAGQ